RGHDRPTNDPSCLTETSSVMRMLRFSRSPPRRRSDAMPMDPAYRTVSREDFPAMLEVGRYAQRTPHFEEIIARTEEHFWNPEDRDYVDLVTPPPADEPLLPFNFIVESHTAVWDKLDD